VVLLIEENVKKISENKANGYKGFGIHTHQIIAKYSHAHQHRFKVLTIQILGMLYFASKVV
jgi:hypothetical protein